MVAMTSAPTANGSLPVTLNAGEEASGLSRIVGQYLEQILADSPEKRSEAEGLRGRLGMRAREGGVAVTIVFSERGITIEEELREPDAVVSGEVEYLMHVLAGRANPAVQAARRRVAFRPGLRRPLFGYQAYRVMRMPGVHLWSGLPLRPVVLTVGAFVLIGLLILARRRQQSSGENDG